MQYLEVTYTGIIQNSEIQISQKFVMLTAESGLRNILDFMILGSLTQLDLTSTFGLALNCSMQH